MSESKERSGEFVIPAGQNALTGEELDLAYFLAGTSDVYEALTRCLSEALRIARVECGAAYLADPSDRAIELKSTLGIPDEVLPRLSQFIEVKGRTEDSGPRVELSSSWVKREDVAGGTPPVPVAILPVEFRGSMVACLILASFVPSELSSEIRENLERLRSRLSAPLARIRELTLEVTHRISAKKDIDGLLLQKQKMEAIGTLASGVAHDFNNLLTGVLGRAYMIKRKASPGSDFYKHAVVIEKAANRAAEVTGLLLDFAEEGEENRMRVEIGRIVDDLCAFLQHAIGGALVLEKQVAEERMVVMADPNQIYQALVNIAINAREAMPAGGRLTISAKFVEGVEIVESPADTEWACIELSDTGPGIPDEILPRVFDPFFTTKPRERGAGIGLSTSWGIVKKHGGHIEVETEQGKGTTFSVLLPLVKKIRKAPEASKQDREIHGSGRILVVDDDDLVREMLGILLAKLGYEVELAVSSKAAIERFREKRDRFGLVLLDFAMPDMMGSDCYKELRKIDPDIPVVMMSGFISEAVKSQLLDSGVRHVVVKPFNPQKLSALVAHVLKSE